jgi:hypothetical protein
LKNTAPTSPAPSCRTWCGRRSRTTAAASRPCRSCAQGRWTFPPDRCQRPAVRIDTQLQKILYAIETQQPYLIVEGLTIRPLNAFRGFKPAPGVEPEVSVLLDIVAFSNTGAEKP